jgi:hypothetical protein
VSQTSGTGSGSFNIGVNPEGQTGQLSGEVTVTPGNSTAPQTIQVYFSVLNTSTGPFGVMDTPVQGATVQGAIGVTGWALDDIEVARVRIYRSPVGTEAPGDPYGVYIGETQFVSDVRPDIASQNPNYPRKERGGWGLMVLTNMLPNSAGSGPLGNGTFTLRAVATDAEGNSAVLGQSTITVNNASATKPFGTLDAPTPGQIVSGTTAVWGWALTPGTAKILENGSTIRVYVDGRSVGYLSTGGEYNISRPDIVSLFPGYTNTNGAAGVFYLNTRTLTNGMHSIAWSVTDNQGRADGIGSRYFFVQN